MKTTPPINEWQFRKLIENTHKQHHKIAYHLSYYSGLKISEIVNLTPKNIKENKGIIKIKERRINLPITWESFFIDYIPITCGIRSLQRAFKLAAARANLPFSLRFGSLRVGFTYRELSNGRDAKWVANTLGINYNSRVSKVSRRYQDKIAFIDITKRFMVLKRDNFRCVLCGRSSEKCSLEIDHIFPISKGGTNKLNNLQTLCHECNCGKKDEISTLNIPKQKILKEDKPTKLKC